MPFRVGPWELVLVLLLALLIFGPGRIGKIGGELGKGISAFKKGLQDDQEESNAESETS
ncbi:MAG: twin-arginine translocase TatA/TatE family subunit [Anaerolineae bacterium]